MKDIYTEIINALGAKEQLALATIINRVGSAPREAGAKYLVKKDGTAVGSIGGGCVEADVWQEARKVIERGEGSILHFKLTSEQLADGGLICGGNIDIFLEPLREDSLNIYREVLRVRQQGGAGILATVISVDSASQKREGVKVFIKASGEKTGSLFAGEELERRILGEAERLLRVKKIEVMTVSSAETANHWKKVEILLEPIYSEPTVYIFGAGHISQQLVPLVKKVHFKTVVIDDREMFANRDRFPEADEIIVSDFKKSFEQITIDNSSYIVIVTRGHLYDGLILEMAVKTEAHYIGMIGSKKKIQTLYQILLNKGIPKEALDKVHAPIGLDINSETPEEIAVSIVAQLIMKRRERLA
ncbi:MAG: XdhC family protein [Thermodesulfobacteriota bacterium]|nr:XdhC family protein [Thermodesulfobacteriota bacterium]